MQTKQELNDKLNNLEQAKVENPGADDPCGQVDLTP